MTEKEILRKEEEIRRDVPEVFLHPQLRDGEVFVDLVPAAEIAGFVESKLKTKGFQSVRTGKGEMVLCDMEKVCGIPGERRLLFVPVFVNLRELIVINDRLSNKSDGECV